MATLKDVKNKIKGVKKTKQITKAMNMVAASKLRNAQGSMEAFRPYARKFSEVLGSLAERAGEGASPLLVPREDVKKVHLVLCTSDRGLCGGFNTNLIEKAEAFVKANPALEVSYTAFGRKGRNWCRKLKRPMLAEHIGIMGTSVSFHEASSAGRPMIQGFLDGAFDEVWVIYAEFLSISRQAAVIKKLLPIPPLEKAETGKAPDGSERYLPEHISEPSAAELLGEMLPRNVFVQIYSALLETSASEHAARMVAMDNATRACNDMLTNLTLVYNKARQAAITAELMDIVGGAEALKG
jgi:F-type H+-transporting ATPase subunit gamma